MKLSLSTAWKDWPYKNSTLIALVVAIIFFAGGAIAKSKAKPPMTDSPALTVVGTTSVSDILREAVVTREAVVEPTNSAPLIARAGGRVTSLKVAAGDTVVAGSILGGIDGGFEPNPTRVQAQTAADVLQIFTDIEKQGLASANKAVEIAEQTLKAARSGQAISTEIRNASVTLATNAIKQAEASLDIARDTDQESTIKAAEVGVDAAKLARTQATAQTKLSTQSAADGVKSSELALQNTKTAQARTAAELASQRTQLAGQLAVLQEQLRLQNIIAPLSGSVTELSISQGDFVSPGQQVGSVVAAGSGKLTFSVDAGVRSALSYGMQVEVFADGADLAGTVTAIGTVPTNSGLYSVEIRILNVPDSALGSNATVYLPVITKQDNAIFLPLNAVVVRSHGVVIFTVDSNNTVREIPVSLKGYHGDMVEVMISTELTDSIITSGNRVLRDGQIVEVK